MNLLINMRICFTVLVLLVVLMLFLEPLGVYGFLFIERPAHISESVVWNKWFRAYEMVVELSESGMNVSSYLPSLQKAYEYLDKGDYGSAERILDKVLSELTKLYEEKDSFVFWRNFRKVTFAVLIGSFPLLFYFFFPRIYLWIWYKVREKWVVKK